MVGKVLIKLLFQFEEKNEGWETRNRFGVGELLCCEERDAFHN